MCRPNVGSGACWSLSAPAIDHAVSQLFLEVIQPPEIELSLAVLREAEVQANDVDRQWKLRLERVRYEARLAERRYKAIDPDYRVVARTLEREWNDKLLEVERVQREYQEVRRRENIDLSEGDRARILSLAKDLPAVWRATTTTNAERKNLLRLVVREVTVSPIDVPERMTRVQVLWPTGAVSDFTVPRKDKYTAQATSTHALALIRDLYLNETKDDQEIAAELNRRGLCTGQDRSWDLDAVPTCCAITAAWRALIVPARAQTATRRQRGCRGVCGAGAPGVKRADAPVWTALPRRVFAFNVLHCPRCGARRRIVAVHTRPETLRRLLERLELTVPGPAAAPSRSPRGRPPNRRPCLPRRATAPRRREAVRCHVPTHVPAPSVAPA
jgi:hypothetical protein